jgi:hypothetical protein
MSMQYHTAHSAHHAAHSTHHTVHSTHHVPMSPTRPGVASLCLCGRRRWALLRSGEEACGAARGTDLSTRPVKRRGEKEGVNQRERETTGVSHLSHRSALFTFLSPSFLASLIPLFHLPTSIPPQSPFSLSLSPSLSLSSLPASLLIPLLFVAHAPFVYQP